MSKYENKRLAAYMWLVVVLAAPLIALVGSQAIEFYRHGTSSERAIIIVVFALLIAVGEMRPIPVARGIESGDEITISTVFGFGLLLVAPVFTAVIAQAAGLVIDYIVHRGSRTRLMFNIAQYAVAYIAARFAYASLATRPFTPTAHLIAPSLVPALAAGAVFLLINNLLVAIAIAINVDVRLSKVLAGDLKWQITTSAPLIGLGPLAVQAMTWTPLAIPLLLMPIAALHHTGTMAMRREQEALRDSLTGLANRAMLTLAATRALSDSLGQTAMLLIDLDHFKDINDTLGHAVGDDMLIAVAQRLQAAAGPQHLIARLGGDEFVVLARGVTERSRAIELAERICSTVRESVVLEGITLTVGCSVGIAFGDPRTPTVSDLLRCADVALYEAKASRGIVAVYDRNNDGHSATHLGLHADLRSAFEDVNDDQLWVAFQPQLDLSTNSMTSLECLIRWQHPVLGVISPDVLVPIAESTSLIDLLLRRVLDTALARLNEWDAQGLDLKLSVNLSARQLSNIALPATVAECLARHGIPASRLVLEVTESRLLSNPELSAQIVRELTRLGAQISIDDFGTGYSSLAHLQRLAVHELKVDKSFTAQLSEPSNAAIVRSTIDLGHNLGLRVVAEGVETVEAAEQLARMGCDVLQGYLISRPIPAADVVGVVSRGAWSLSGGVPVDDRILELTAPAQLAGASLRQAG